MPNEKGTITGARDDASQASNTFSFFVLLYIYYYFSQDGHRDITRPTTSAAAADNHNHNKGLGPQVHDSHHYNDTSTRVEGMEKCCFFWG
jgi:hypothetical protein